MQRMLQNPRFHQININISVFNKIEISKQLNVTWQQSSLLAYTCGIGPQELVHPTPCTPREQAPAADISGFDRPVLSQPTQQYINQCQGQALVPFMYRAVGAQCHPSLYINIRLCFPNTWQADPHSTAFLPSSGCSDHSLKGPSSPKCFLGCAMPCPF